MCCDHCDALFNAPDRPEGSTAEALFDAYDETGHFPSCKEFPRAASDPPVGHAPETRPCYVCDGTGTIARMAYVFGPEDDQPCHECGGTGQRAPSDPPVGRAPETRELDSIAAKASYNLMTKMSKPYTPAPETRKCLCGHSQSNHVPFPAVGDLGWYGCVECDRSDSERCKFFCAASDPPVGKDSSAEDGFPYLSPNPEETDRPGTWDDAEEPQDSGFEELSILLDTLRPHLYECDCAFCANWKGVSGAISRYVEQLKTENARLRERVLSDSEMRELRNATMLHSSGISEELRRKLRRSTQGDTAQ